ncbi:hypothetical protein [Cellulophaga sp. Z1A5H]|uniref:hypothetical protein n=1 Tax=Cellulophaga sp. Z1A5H TaxID=2687291 RepID=UPI0013FD61AE|nr:hypothetical protein [Cellulophaga sp. Z1A5H]
MSSKNNKPRKKILAFGSEENKILGLDAFMLKIEKDFFCNVSIVSEDTSVTKNDLVLDINFNFNIKQGLSILAEGKLEGHDLMLKNEDGHFFFTALEKLRNASRNTFDIKELNLIFEDCTIIIYRIFENSIPLEIDKLILELHKNYIYYTKGLSQLPYEIHIPVLEKSNFLNKKTLLNCNAKEIDQKNYNGFWGLYFDSIVDSEIYDSQSKEIIYGKLTMLE